MNRIKFASFQTIKHQNKEKKHEGKKQFLKKEKSQGQMYLYSTLYIYPN